MADTSGQAGWMRAGTQAQPHPRLWHALSGAAPALLFGLRMWASVCLALYLAFWLQLANADWAGTTAFIVCQPQLGASLRKGWYRLVGTLIGATAIVVVTAFFIQERVAFLGTLAVWGAFCAFASTVLRNFASYSAALAGYTAIIVAADALGATGGPHADVFMLSVMRASEICIGIVSAGVVLAGTDLGATRRRLADLLATLGTEIAGRFAGMLAQAGGELPQTQAVRRDLMRRVIALDPIIDQALGEASQLRYHSPVLQRARHGLFTAIDGWRCVATRLQGLPPDAQRREAQPILQTLPPELRAAPAAGAPARWTADPLGLRRSCEGAARRLLALPAATPSQRLIADQTAMLLAGMAQVFGGLGLLVDAPGRPRRRGPGFRLSVPDFLPALLNAVRAFLAIAAVELIWVVTAWPSGATAILFTAILVLLFSPRGDAAYASASAFAVGTAICICLTAIVKFAVLPGLETFAALSAALGLYLIPVGFGLAYSQKPAAQAALTAVGIGFVPLLDPANEMTYDTQQFYNSALAIFAGTAAAVLVFALLPPLSPAVRTRRLLAFALRDLQRCAIAPDPPEPNAWEARMYGRLEALPEQAPPEQLSHLLGAFAVGSAVLRLRRIASALAPALQDDPDLHAALNAELGAALAALARGDVAATQSWLARLDGRLAAAPIAGQQAALALRARASILVLSEMLARHVRYFDARAAA